MEKNDNKFLCDFCNKSYSTKSNLKAHQQRTKKCIDKRMSSLFSKELNNRRNSIDHSDRIDSDIKKEKIFDSPISICRSIRGKDYEIKGEDNVKIESQLNYLLSLNNKMSDQITQLTKRFDMLLETQDKNVTHRN